MTRVVACDYPKHCSAITKTLMITKTQASSRELLVSLHVYASHCRLCWPLRAGLFIACALLTIHNAGAESNVVRASLSMSVQTTNDGRNTLAWTVDRAKVDASTASRDAKWLVDSIGAGLAEPPVMVPPHPLPRPPVDGKIIRSIDIYLSSPFRHRVDFRNTMVTSKTVPHSVAGTTLEYCDHELRASVDIPSDETTGLFISSQGKCDRCMRKAKDCIIAEGRYRSGHDQGVEYGRKFDHLKHPYQAATVVWRTLDPLGRLLFEDRSRPSNERSEAADLTYNGGHFLQIRPVVLLSKDIMEMDCPKYELFSSYKKISELAYTGNVGDKVVFLLNWFGSENIGTGVEQMRYQPWIVGNEYTAEPHRLVPLEASIVEVIQGPPLAAIYIDPENIPFGFSFNWEGLEFSSNFEFSRKHPACGIIPPDFRAIILKTHPKNPVFTRYIIGFQGSLFKRKHWIFEDLPQFFGLVPEYYSFASKVADYVYSQNIYGQPISITGHSLGGGLAQYAVGRLGTSGHGYGFNPATLGSGAALELGSRSKGFGLNCRFTVIQNNNDVVSNNAGWLIGNRWVFSSGLSSFFVLGHTINSIDLEAFNSLVSTTGMHFEP